jgi:O-antigen/teichoic acid export membrane protein
MLFRYSAARVIFTISSYLGTLLYSLILDPHVFGTIATFLTILTIAMGLDMGLNNLLSTHAANAPSDRKDIRAPVLFNGVLILATAISYFILVPTLYQTLDLKNSFSLSAVLLAYIVSGTVLNPALNLALLEGKPKAAIFINGVHTIVRVLVNATYFFVFGKSDISTLVFGYLFINLSFNVTIIWLADLGRYVLASTSTGWRINGSTLKLIAPTLVYSIASVTFTNADKTVISYFLKPIDYGYYYLACSLILGIYALYSSAIGSYLIPNISRRIVASPVSQGPVLVSRWMRFHVAALSLIHICILSIIAVAGTKGLTSLKYTPFVYYILSAGCFYNYCTLGYSPIIVANGRWRVPLEASVIGCFAWAVVLAFVRSIDVSKVSVITASILLLNYLYQWTRLRHQVKTSNLDTVFVFAPFVITTVAWLLSFLSILIQLMMLMALGGFFLHRTLRLLKEINT